MNKLQKLEDNTQTHKEIASLIPLAVERTGSELSKEYMYTMAIDIAKEFRNHDLELIKTALKKGALGHFGSTFKLTTQEVCIWIRKEKRYRVDYYPDGRPKVNM